MTIGQLPVMNVKTRAIHAEDKEERRHAILDAAEQLLLAHPQRIPSVEEVAATARLAKGTVYLYFPSKEELLLAIHDRNSVRFFDALQTLLDSRKSVEFDDMFRVVRKQMVEVPGYLPLAALCFGLMEKSVPMEAAAAHKQRIGERLRIASVSLERQFTGLPAGRGISVLMHSYALIVGLWQMIHPSPLIESLPDHPNYEFLHRDYLTELESGLRAVWNGHIVHRVTDTAAAATKSNKPAGRTS
jgi:AcrR family transcriptional regulator